MPPEKEIVPETTRQTHDIECLVNALRELVVDKRHNDSSLVIRIAGSTALGKSTLARKLADSFFSVPVIPTDSFMLDREERYARKIVHGDDPRTIDFEGLNNAVKQLASGNTIEIHLYDHQVGRHTTTKELSPSSSNIIIIEGSSALYDDIQLPCPTISIFLDANEATRVKLRHEVNINERGYTEEQFERELPIYRMAYEVFIEPSKTNADHVIMVDKNRTYESPLISQCICSTPS